MTSLHRFPDAVGDRTRLMVSEAEMSLTLMRLLKAENLFYGYLRKK